MIIEKDFLRKDTMNCAEKAMKISHLNPNQSAPSIYNMIEIYFFSLDQWEIRIHLLWGKSFNIHHCDPHLNQTKFNDLLPLTIHGVLKIVVMIVRILMILMISRWSEHNSGNPEEVDRRRTRSGRPLRRWSTNWSLWVPTTVRPRYCNSQRLCS